MRGFESRNKMVGKNYSVRHGRHGARIGNFIVQSSDLYSTRTIEVSHTVKQVKIIPFQPDLVAIFMGQVRATS